MATHPFYSVRVRGALGTLFAALLLQTCATAQKKTAGPPASPIFLWQVTAKDQPGVVYLNGSIHLQSETSAAMDRAVQLAMERADELVVEVDTSALDQAQVNRLTLQKGVLTAEDTLQNHVSPDTYKALTQCLAELGLSQQRFDRLRPWLAALTLTVIKMKLDGYRDDLGVDRLLINEAKTREKPVRALETVEFQLDLFAQASAQAQESMLLQAIHEVSAQKTSTAIIEQAYRSGDSQQLEKAVLPNVEDHPEFGPFFQAVFVKRNQDMGHKLKLLLAEKRTFFFVVGVGHLVGQQGIIALLQRQGCTIKAIQPQGPVASNAQMAIGRAAQWYPLDHKEFGFKALFPAEPKVTRKVVPAKKSPADQSGVGDSGVKSNQARTITFFLLDQTVVAFAVTAITIDNSDATPLPEKIERTLLETLAARWVGSLDGEVLQKQWTDFHGKKALSIKAAFAGGTAHCYWLTHNNRSLQIGVVFLGKIQKDDRRKRASKKFFNSFEFRYTPK